MHWIIEKLNDSLLYWSFVSACNALIGFGLYLVANSGNAPELSLRVIQTVASVSLTLAVVGALMVANEVRKPA